MKTLSQEALNRFKALAWPSKTDEEWRRTDPALFPRVEMNGARPSCASFEAGWEALAPKLIQQGVILTDLVTAQKIFPELLEEYLLGTGELEGLKKFAAWHQALFQQGLFCYVPDGLSVEAPLTGWIKAPSSGGNILPHTLIVLGEGSQLTFIEEKRGGDGPAQPLFSNEMVEVVLKQGSHLKFIHLQRWDLGVSEVISQRALLEGDAQLLHMIVGLGGKITKANIETALTGAGARSDLLGIFLGSGLQHFDIHTLQDHQAPHTTSDLLYKSALKDTAKAVYTGLIRIRKQAQKSDAYQANRNLLLNQGAKADSIPMLEIEADDVRCTHGVAVGPVDPEQTFYLMSRGLAAAEAQRLIVEGFFEQVVRRLPVEGLPELLMNEVNLRLGDAHASVG